LRLTICQVFASSASGCRETMPRPARWREPVWMPARQARRTRHGPDGRCRTHGLVGSARNPDPVTSADGSLWWLATAIVATVPDVENGSTRTPDRPAALASLVCLSRTLLTLALASPSATCALPTAFSALHINSVLLSPVMQPATSSTVPFASFTDLASRTGIDRQADGSSRRLQTRRFSLLNSRRMPSTKSR
jgi:hypothetical protein